MAADYHIFEGLTIRNTDIAFYAGLKEVMGTKGLTVRNSRIEDVGMAVTTEYAGSRDFYIADNVIIGRDDRYHLNGWASPGIYRATPLKSYYAIKVHGSGHVVRHNAIAYFHDAICVSTYGTPERDQDLKAVSIDFCNNDIHLMVDDFIEADGGVHNIRVMRNRGVNAAQTGPSGQLRDYTLSGQAFRNFKTLAELSAATGQAPDLGAYEVGTPIPIYGPRSAQLQSFYR